MEALLTLASSESGLTALEPVDLAGAATSALLHLQPEIDRLGIHMDQSTPPATLEGDPVLIERLVANLLTNAVLHNVIDGHIEIVTQVDEGRAVLSVTNTGAHIEPADVDRLFQPFQRLDPRRVHHKEGHGLGLSIVRAIASAHHAVLDASALPEGGLCVRIEFAPPSETQFAVAASSRTAGE